MKKLILILLYIPVLSFSQGDCPSQFICSGGSFTAVTDITDELNSTNNGCLSVNEGTTSYWYQICTSTTGTIRFTISPLGSNNDYDWAVWNGTSCPPITTPIRCSFAISTTGPGGDNTGVSSINNAPQTDNSEGAGGNQWTQDIIATAGQCFTICINNYGAGSNNFGLSFGGTSVLSCSALPVELTYFTCKEDDKKIILNWNTLSEINNEEFQIWKSLDGVEYIKIGIIEGSGTNTTEKNWEYIDSNPYIGSNIYQLRQKDFDGNINILKTISCNFEDLNETDIIYYNLIGQRVNYKNSSTGFYFKYYKKGNKVITEKIYKQ